MNPNIYAKVICDSVSPLGIRLTSVELQLPRFVLPQLLMTRLWSRSCESLRARPVKSKWQEVADNPYIPTFKQNQKGMSPGPVLSLEDESAALEAVGELHLKTLNTVTRLMELGVCKEIANRYLEPFCYQRVLVTSTDFKNFLRLRCASDAQEEIQEVANRLQEALVASAPVRRAYHYPYVTENEFANWSQGADKLRRVCMARCARISYLTHDGKRDTGKDLELAETLITSGHSNPAEHGCEMAPDNRRYGNHKGWISFRYQLEQTGVLPDPEG